MNIFRASWDDLSNNSDSSYLPQTCNTNTDDLSYHIPPTHTHELENSQSGLNTLFKLTNLNCYDTPTFNQNQSKNETINEIITSHAFKEGSNSNFNHTFNKKLPSFSEGEKTPNSISKTRKSKILLKNLDLTQEEITELSCTKTLAKRGIENYQIDHDAPSDKNDVIEPLHLSELLLSPISKTKGNKDSKKPKKNRKSTAQKDSSDQTTEHTPRKNQDLGKPSSKKKRKHKRDQNDKNGLINGLNKSFRSPNEQAQIPLYYQSTVGFMPILIPNSVNQYSTQLSNYPFMNMNTHVIKSVTNSENFYIPASNTISTPSTTISNVNSSKEASNSSENISERRLDSRLKEIAVGKSTLGYRNYVKTVPKKLRTDLDPETPNPLNNSSASEFRAKCQTWRRTLHKYDTTTS